MAKVDPLVKLVRNKSFANLTRAEWLELGSFGESETLEKWVYPEQGKFPGLFIERLDDIEESNIYLYSGLVGNIINDISLVAKFQTQQQGKDSIAFLGVVMTDQFQSKGLSKGAVVGGTTSMGEQLVLSVSDASENALERFTRYARQADIGDAELVEKQAKQQIERDIKIQQKF